MACLSTALALCTSLAGPGYPVDGDTFRTDDGVYIRIIYMDAPESDWRAKCDAERFLGVHAKAYAAELLAGEFIVIPSGTIGAWWRPEATVILPDGRTLQEAMVDAKLGAWSLDKTNHPWCGDS